MYHGFHADVENGSAASELSLPMRITASWARVSAPIEYKDVARMLVHHTRAPLERRHPDHSKCAVLLEAFKDEPSVSANAPILDRFCARRLYSIAWVGAKKRAIRSSKEGKENG
jgi:hypothetical protein